jgi:predicted nucleic acid-binding protein
VKIYFDLCIYNRPFDDQGQPRIVIETTELLFLLEKAINGEIRIINSFALEYENGKNPIVDRREKIRDLLGIAPEYVRYSERLGNRAMEIEKIGFRAMDALHIACAEAVKSDFFITCDDLLLNRGRANKEKLNVTIISLMDFVSKEVFRI